MEIIEFRTDSLQVSGLAAEEAAGGGLNVWGMDVVPSIPQFLASHVKLDFEPIKTFPIVSWESFFIQFDHWTSGLKLGTYRGNRNLAILQKMAYGTFSLVLFYRETISRVETGSDK